MEKTAYFVADAQNVLRSFPVEVRRLFGYEIMRLQQGLRPNHYRPMTKAIGPEVGELKVKHRGEYRAFYFSLLADFMTIRSPQVMTFTSSVLSERKLNRHQRPR